MADPQPVSEAPLHTVVPANEVALIHDQLEVSSWEPWLRFSLEELHHHREVFPEGQLCIWRRDGTPLGALTTTRTEWSGDPVELTTWDDVAGSDRMLDGPYESRGNTLVFMSMSVHPAERSRGYAQKLIAAAMGLARRLGVEHLIGDFRPSGFGAYKRLTGDVDFGKYVRTTRADGELVDGWLRTVARFGAVFHKIDPRAMVVEVGLDELERYRSEAPERWWAVREPELRRHLAEFHRPFDDVEPGEVWECGEAGSWFVDLREERGVYVEANYWAELPLEVPELHPSLTLQQDEVLRDGSVEYVVDLRYDLRPRTRA